MNRISQQTAFSGCADSKRFLFLFVFLAMALVPQTSNGGELAGSISSQLWFFPREPLHEGQERNDASFALQPKYSHGFEGGSSMTFAPFYRYDGADSERTHFDIREMNYHLVLESIEFRAGVGKVFWGATEFIHLVDIINQTDLVENPNGEDKLGQPMLQIIKPLDFGTFEVFVLPYFRERTFPGKGGRFRSSIPVNTDNPRYENRDKERHVDIASRLSGTVGIMDFGLSYFRGTGREPMLLMLPAPDGSVSIVPYYAQIEQGSIDLQAVAGALLLKLEALRRTGQGRAFYSYGSGLEYTLAGLFGSRYDLGVIVEYAYDSRKADSSTAFQSDVMLGLRLALNDFSGTEVLAGYIYDTDYDSKALRVKGSRRVGKNLKLNLEAGVFFDIDPKDILYDIRNDDYIMLTLSYYL